MCFLSYFSGRNAREQQICRSILFTGNQDLYWFWPSVKFLWFWCSKSFFENVLQWKNSLLKQCVRRWHKWMNKSKSSCKEHVNKSSLSEFCTQMLGWRLTKWSLIQVMAAKSVRCINCRYLRKAPSSEIGKIQVNQDQIINANSICHSGDHWQIQRFFCVLRRCFLL